MKNLTGLIVQWVITILIPSCLVQTDHMEGMKGSADQRAQGRQLQIPLQMNLLRRYDYRKRVNYFSSYVRDYGIQLSFEAPEVNNMLIELVKGSLQVLSGS
jgi:hypothetical protein